MIVDARYATNKKGQCAVFVTEDKTMVMVGRKWRSKWWRIVCFGRKRHYRKDGSCKHVEQVLAATRPDIRARTKIDGFGDRRPRGKESAS